MRLYLLYNVEDTAIVLIASCHILLTRDVMSIAFPKLGNRPFYYSISLPLS